MNHIREKLPDMKARLNTLMGQAQQELNTFGDSAAFGDANQVRSISYPYHIYKPNCILIAFEFTARFPHPPSHDTICS